MTNLTHAHINKIVIPTVLESSVVQIKSSLFKQGHLGQGTIKSAWRRSLYTKGQKRAETGNLDKKLQL